MIPPPSFFPLSLKQGRTLSFFFFFWIGWCTAIFFLSVLESLFSLGLLISFFPDVYDATLFLSSPSGSFFYAFSPPFFFFPPLVRLSASRWSPFGKKPLLTFLFFFPRGEGAVARGFSFFSRSVVPESGLFRFRRVGRGGRSRPLFFFFF